MFPAMPPMAPAATALVIGASAPAAVPNSAKPKHERPVRSSIEPYNAASL
jgi:hypothetical protein